MHWSACTAYCLNWHKCITVLFMSVRCIVPVDTTGDYVVRFTLDHVASALHADSWTKKNIGIISGQKLNSLRLAPVMIHWDLLRFKLMPTSTHLDSPRFRCHSIYINSFGLTQTCRAHSSSDPCPSESIRGNFGCVYILLCVFSIKLLSAHIVQSQLCPCLKLELGFTDLI